VLKEALFGAISCGPEKANYTIPCQHCWLQAESLALTYLLDNNPLTSGQAQAWEKQVLQDTISKYNAGNGSFEAEFARHFPVEQGTISFPYPDSRPPLQLRLEEYSSSRLGV
jgi:Niemann-Pick C1 protein